MHIRISHHRFRTRVLGELGLRLWFGDSSLYAMEEAKEGSSNLSAVDSHKKNCILVSNTKKPLFHYVNLAKRHIQQHSEVELSALGMAISTVISVVEILKSDGLAIEKKILTSTVDNESKGRPIQKAKIEITLEKIPSLDESMAVAECK